MSAEFGSGWMADYASRFQTRTTRVVASGSAGQLVVAQNPRRWYLEIWGDGMANTFGALCPGPVPPVVGPAANQSAPWVFKYKDAPAITTGEFYSVGAPFSGWTVIEQILTGG